MKTIRLLIADDIAPVRKDLITMLELVGGIEIVGEAANGLEAVHLAEALHPEVVLMDIDMPLMDGCEAARQIKAHSPTCRVIALTVHDYEAVRQRTLQVGMDDFVVKGAPLDILMRAIRAPAVRE